MESLAISKSKGILTNEKQIYTFTVNDTFGFLRGMINRISDLP